MMQPVLMILISHLPACPSQSDTVNNCLDSNFTPNDQNHTRSNFCENSKSLELSCCSSKVVNGQKSLEGLRILLAEDTPVLQRVATIMLQKLGASVVIVGDGMQAVDALSALENDSARNETKTGECPLYDLILMDCQVRYFKLILSSCFIICLGLNLSASVL